MVSRVSVPLTNDRAYVMPARHFVIISLLGGSYEPPRTPPLPMTMYHIYKRVVM